MRNKYQTKSIDSKLNDIKSSLVVSPVQRSFLPSISDSLSPVAKHHFHLSKELLNNISKIKAKRPNIFPIDASHQSVLNKTSECLVKSLSPPQAQNVKYDESPKNSNVLTLEFQKLKTELEVAKQAIEEKNSLINELETKLFGNKFYKKKSGNIKELKDQLNSSMAVNGINCECDTEEPIKGKQLSSLELKNKLKTLQRAYNRLEISHNLETQALIKEIKELKKTNRSVQNEFDKCSQKQEILKKQQEKKEKVYEEIINKKDSAIKELKEAVAHKTLELQRYAELMNFNKHDKEINIDRQKDLEEQIAGLIDQNKTLILEVDLGKKMLKEALEALEVEKNKNIKLENQSGVLENIKNENDSLNDKLKESQENLEALNKNFKALQIENLLQKKRTLEENSSMSQSNTLFSSKSSQLFLKINKSQRPNTLVPSSHEGSVVLFSRINILEEENNILKEQLAATTGNYAKLQLSINSEKKTFKELDREVCNEDFSIKFTEE